MIASKPLKSQERGHKKYKKSFYLPMTIRGSRNIISPFFGLYEPLSLY